MAMASWMSGYMVGQSPQDPKVQPSPLARTPGLPDQARHGLWRRPHPARLAGEAGVSPTPGSPGALRPAGVPQLRQGLRFDLPDPLTGHAELPADLLQRPEVSVQEAEPELEDLPLPLGQCVQDRVEVLLQEDERSRVDRDDGLGVLDEVAEEGVLLLAHGGLQREGLLGELQDLLDPLGG